MATYKVVDADQLNADMTSVADSIRTKGGTTDALAWPDGYKTAIDSIPAGSAPSLQSKSVTYTENGTATIAPDEGYDGLSSVDVTVDVAGSGGSGFPNGTEWTQSNITSGAAYTLYNSNGIWVAGSTNGAGLYYSTDGKTWTQSNITSIHMFCVYNANGIWVAGGNGGIYYSTDGMIWTQSNITGKSISSVHNANGIWVAGSRSALGVTLKGFYYSTDGKHKVISQARPSIMYTTPMVYGLLAVKMLVYILP